MISIPADDILSFMEGCMKYPFPQICRHLVACDLYSVLEKHGYLMRRDLADAIVQCRDEDALAILAEERAKLKE